MTDDRPDMHPFATLQPALLLDMVEAAGVRADGRLLALNSYENRVYQVGVEADTPMILKAYRPGRRDDAAIREEHAFARQLAEHDIPVVPPLSVNGETLHHAAGYRFALYPRRGGHAPELDNADTREWLGRLLGRLHNVGAAGRFLHRPVIDVAVTARQNRDWLVDGGWIPEALVGRYQSITETLFEQIAERFGDAGAVVPIRLHGDFHPGNILWTDAGPHLVDLDDCCTGPAIQDIWMMLSGDRRERTIQLADLIAGYEQFRAFDPRELHLLEALRTLRIVNYAAWLARRWADPAFPATFIWFGDERYWEDHLMTLAEQIDALEAPVLAV
jgi:Ser/Thr protein kinase RdoA (MazF antagonist)